MNFDDASIKVIGWDECPLYRVEDEFRLSGTSIIPPRNKPMCIVLAGDILEILIRHGGSKSDHKYLFDCSECTGLIRLEYSKEKKHTDRFDKKDPEDIDAVVNLLGRFPFFQALDADDIRDIVSFLRLKKFEKGDAVIRKGEPGRNLFIIVSGRVEVLGNGGMRIAFLEKGEIFGEMSLLSGNPVVATIKVVEPARLLYLNGDDFRKVLHRFPSLQMYLACLLAQRLAKTNLIKSEELSSGMIGKLSEMPPPGLFQTLNLNQKTGVLTFDLPEGTAEVSFRDGELIGARYKEKQGEEAFFEILKMKEGIFKFTPGLSPEAMKTREIGDFMALLMEGVKKIDEEESISKS